MPAKKYDTIIIGAGPGGYTAALKLAQKGQKVALVEKDAVGGLCLNYGCIPTKNLISQIKRYTAANVSLPPYSTFKRKREEVVQTMRRGLEGLIRANKIDIITGEAKFIGLNEVQIMPSQEVLQFSKAIIATGSKSRSLPNIVIDGNRIHDSTTFLKLDSLPENVGIVGGGYIGCEYASLLNKLGVKVTMIEALPKILASHGEKVSKALTEHYKNEKITLYTGAKVIDVITTSKGVEVHLASGEKLIFDALLIAIGREADTAKLQLSECGVKCDAKGNIITNQYLETSNPSVYAIGDVIGKINLAHMASHEAEIVVQNILDEKTSFECRAFTSIVFTFPEIASIGFTEEECKNMHIEVLTGLFPFAALGRAICDGKNKGFAEIVAEKKSGKIIGAHVFHEDASAIIAEMTVVVSQGMTLDQLLKNVIHPHPTYSEVWQEVALMAQGTPLHIKKSN